MDQFAETLVNKYTVKRDCFHCARGIVTCNDEGEIKKSLQTTVPFILTAWWKQLMKTIISYERIWAMIKVKGLFSLRAPQTELGRWCHLPSVKHLKVFVQVKCCQIRWLNKICLLFHRCIRIPKFKDISFPSLTCLKATHKHTHYPAPHRCYSLSWSYT